MRILIDTHILLWHFMGSERLKPALRSILFDETNLIEVSVASIWEISIKVSQGKLDLSGGHSQLMNFINRTHINIMPIESVHIETLYTLAWHHRDPFDRMIAAQAIAEQIDLISDDIAFDAYFEAQTTQRLR